MYRTCRHCCVAHDAAINGYEYTYLASIMSIASSKNSSTTVNTCLNILKRCSITEAEKNFMDLSELMALNENAIQELKRENPYMTLSLKNHIDSNDSFKRSYILCEYNRVGDSYRSPWTNTLDPPSAHKTTHLDEGQGAIYGPPESLRKLEILYNEVFASYRDAYYGKDAVSSVYLWDTSTIPHHSHRDLSPQEFSACFAIKKSIETQDHEILGFWNSLHVVNIGEISGGSACYKMKTSVFVSLNNSSVVNPPTEALYATTQNKTVNSTTGSNKATVDAALTRQMERTLKFIDGNHLVNIGKMIEDAENDIRSSMDAIYIPKTKEIVEALHSTNDEASPKSVAHRERKQQVSMELNEEMLARILKKSITSPL